MALAAHVICEKLHRALDYDNPLHKEALAMSASAQRMTSAAATAANKALDMAGAGKRAHGGKA